MAASDNPWMRNICGFLTYIRRAWSGIVGLPPDENGDDADAPIEFPWTNFLQRLHGGHSEMPERCRILLGCVNVLTVALVIALAMENVSPDENNEQGVPRQINNDGSGSTRHIEGNNEQAVDDEFVGEDSQEFQVSLPTIQEERGEARQEDEAGDEGEQFVEGAEAFGVNCEDCRVVCSDCREAAKRTIRILTECGCPEGAHPCRDCRVCGGSSITGEDNYFVDHFSNGCQRRDLDEPKLLTAERRDCSEANQGTDQGEVRDNEHNTTGSPLYWRRRVLDLLAPSLPPLPSVVHSCCEEDRAKDTTTSDTTSSDTHLVITISNHVDPEPSLSCEFRTGMGQPPGEQRCCDPEHNETFFELEAELPPETSHEADGLWGSQESALPPSPNIDEERSRDSSGWDLEETGVDKNHPAHGELMHEGREQANDESGYRHRLLDAHLDVPTSSSSSSCRTDDRPRSRTPVPRYDFGLNYDARGARAYRSRPATPSRPSPSRRDLVNLEDNNTPTAFRHQEGSSWQRVNDSTWDSLPDYYRHNSRSPGLSGRASRFRDPSGGDRGGNEPPRRRQWQVGQSDHAGQGSPSMSSGLTINEPSTSSSRLPEIDQPWIHEIGSAAHRERCNNRPRGRIGDRRAKCGQIMVRTLKEDPVCVLEEGRTTRQPGHEDRFFVPRRGDVIVRHILCPGRGVIEVYFSGIENDLQDGDSIVRMQMDAATYPTMIIVKAKAYVFLDGRWIYVGRHQHGIRKTDHRELD